MRRFSWLFFLFCLFFASGAFASPESNEAAEKARRSYTLGQYDEALRSFEEAYKLSGDARFLFNIAQCHRLLEHPQEAIRFYRTYLNESPNTQYREEIEKKIKSLEESANQPKSQEATPTPVNEEDAALDQDLQRLEEQLAKSQEELTRTTKKVKYFIPGGLFLAGSVFGAGAISLRNNIQSSRVTSNDIQRQRVILALSSDLCFAGAGVSFYLAYQKDQRAKDAAVSLAPLSGGAVVSILWEGK